MDFNFSEWLNLAVRWIHVFAGIMWVGQTYFFTWLDGQLHAEERTKPGSKAQVWMVHSGGFYVVEKQGLEKLPAKLRWFRWEALFTWITGIILLTIVYYMGGVLIDDSVSNISQGAAIGVGLGLLIAGWVVYDLLMQSPLGKFEMAIAGVFFVLVVAITWGLTHLVSGRAAYIHVGAMFGTIMTANVWFRILPNQKKIIALSQEGKVPDPALAAQAKLRSKQNTFMAVPVVFIMLSNHFPTATYGSRYNWVVLAALVLAGWGAAKLIREA